MNQETTVRPELYVKLCMALVALSLVTIAICQVIQVTRPPQQPMMRRPVVPMENRMMQQGMPGMPPGGVQGQGMPEGMMPSGGPQGPGAPEGAAQRPPLSPGQGPGQPPEKSPKK